MKGLFAFPGCQRIFACPAIRWCVWASDWASFEETLGVTYHPTQGAPGVSTRLMVALHYLKYQHDLSDENVLAHWLENPYWQHFSLERNRLRGTYGDAINAMLAAAAMNFHKLLGAFWLHFLCAPLAFWGQLLLIMAPPSANRCHARQSKKPLFQDRLLIVKGLDQWISLFPTRS